MFLKHGNIEKSVVNYKAIIDSSQNTCKKNKMEVRRRTAPKYLVLLKLILLVKSRFIA